MRTALGLYGCAKELAMKSVLYPNLKTELCHATNNWHSDIEGNEKYKWFYTFKDSFFTNRYLSFIATKRFRDTLTGFRVRACGLRNHKVWFQTEISENSSCPMCGHLLVDEVHFLFQCPAYLHLREKYVSTESVSQPNWSNVRNILACENESKTINLSKNLAFALDIRKNKSEIERFFKTVWIVLIFDVRKRSLWVVHFISFKCFVLVCSCT